MMEQGSLFEPTHAATESREPLRTGALVLRGFARSEAAMLLVDLEAICRQAPLRHMQTPGGFRMSVGMTNCGPLGWISDRRGYRYDSIDPLSGRPWPAVPVSFLDLASRAASESGYGQFVPDACLVNRYEPGARLTPHQDKDERDFREPIVSVSLGLSAVFQFGGPKRADTLVRIVLQHGDTVVWGGVSRLCYHGVLPLRAGIHPATGTARINLTFRRAG